MSDLVKDIKYLRYYYTSEDSLKDKDILKNKSYFKYVKRVEYLFLVPLTFQLWQISLVNNLDKVALYNKVRVFKILTLVGAIGFGIKEKIDL